MEQGQFTFNTGQLIAFGSLLIGLLIAIVAIIRLRWSMREMTENHFEQFKKDFWGEFNRFREGCSKHRQETATLFGGLEVDNKNIKERLTRIEDRFNSK